MYSMTRGFFMRIFLILCFQLVELSKAQDVEAGDGTTSVCVIAGSLLEAAQTLLQKGATAVLIAQCLITRLNFSS